MILPPSFKSNTLDRMVEFLNESNRIESITEVDFGDERFRKIGEGHFGALVESQRLAVARVPLSHKHIMQWQGMLTREQLKFGHHIEENEVGRIRSPSLPKNVRIGKHIPPDYNYVPTLFTHLIEEINEGLKDQEKLKDDAEYAKFLGRSFQKFESIHPFADGNGRTGRLLAAYIATFCHRPIVVFRSEMRERNAYYNAHETVEKMCTFMATKLQEVIFNSKGDLLTRTEQLSGLSYRYTGRLSDQSIDYEWHALRDILDLEAENPISPSLKRKTPDSTMNASQPKH